MYRDSKRRGSKRPTPRAPKTPAPAEATQEFPQRRNLTFPKNQRRARPRTPAFPHLTKPQTMWKRKETRDNERRVFLPVATLVAQSERPLAFHVGVCCSAALRLSDAGLVR